MYQGLAGRRVKAWCSDGKVRTATFTAEADTYFSAPARVTVNGKTVSGFASGIEQFRREGIGHAPEGVEHEFWSRGNGKNGGLLPPMPPFIIE